MTDIQLSAEKMPPPPVPAAAAAPIDVEDAVRLNAEPVVPEILAPLMASAASDLSALVERRGWEVASAVRADLVAWYGQLLARLTNLVVLQRFSSFHMVMNPLWRPPFAEAGDAVAGAPRKVLDAYIAWESVERLLTDDGPYPELGRMVKEARGHWLVAATELLERVERHRDEVARLAGLPTASLAELTGARFGISDPHEGGRTAAILSFGARRVVYKPRSLDGEVAWDEVAARVVREGLGLEARRLRLAAFDGYGFMEHVDADPCLEEAAVARCYRRYGALLALAHALGTCDLHHENVIVSGEYPVVIDAEPLFRARLAISGSGEARLGFERNLSLDGLEARESVLELGLLPLTMRVPLPVEGVRLEYDVGALCSYAREPVVDLVPCGRGSDHVQMRFVAVQASRFPNLPVRGGCPFLPADFLDDVVAGFEKAHDYLRERSGEYAGPGGVLERYAAHRVRMLARPTMDYISVLSRSLSPEPLRSTEARARRVEEDLRELGALRFDAVRDLSPAEAASLRAGDVPRFEVAASDTHCGDVALLTTPLESARARWAALDAFDRNLQSTCIRERLLDRAGGMAAPLSSASPGALERRALEFAAVLALAAGAPDGGPGWVYASYAPGLGATMAHADRESLYEGAAGTALFLAEAGRVAGERDWGRLASGVFGPVVRGETPVAVRRSGGIGRGLGGLLYAMTRVADATGDEALLEAAVRVALEEGPRLAHADVLDEVLYGRAGLLLSVLALHTRRPSEPLRAVADVVARRLLRRAVSGERGTYWPVSSGPPMPHVSHGAAGIAMALARWARLRGDDAAARVAVRALEFDDTFWLDGEQGWIDARFEEKEGGPEHRTTWSWCNGRSGGLLARLAVAEALETPFPTGCTQHALKADGTDVMADVLPGLCCGTPGAVDALLHLHQRAPGHGAGERAASAIELLARETPRSHYSTLTASLFTGTAGLAFAFLRAARTEEVSSVLWFG